VAFKKIKIKNKQIEVMKEHEFNVRVRYSETDQMGVVYHGNYAQYFEMGRVEWLRNLGISYKWMEENGIMLPVVSLNINYKKPARYDDLLTVKTIFKSQTSVKIEFDYEIYNENKELLTIASSILVFVDMKTSRPTLPPVYVNEKLSKM
jgi:acyl-CoA thioester hydrolase